MKLRVVVSLVFAAASVLAAQNDTRLRTSGACSPAISGGGNKITISCSGVSTAKADQMITLMNRILAQRLDLTQVNAKLDSLTSAMSDINATLNPLEGASPAQKQIVHDATAVLTACSAFLQDWQGKQTDAMQNANRKRQTSEPASAGLSALHSDDDRQRAEFTRIFAPRLNALGTRLQALVPDAPQLTDYSSPANSMEASRAGLQVFALARRYQQQQMQMNRPINTALISDAQKLYSDCVAFASAWNHADLTSLQQARELHQQQQRPQPTFGMNLDDAAASQELQKYRSTLEPRLAALKSQMAPLAPDFTSDKDYDAANTQLQVSAVCMDFYHLQSAYQQKIADDLQAHRSQPSAR